MSARPKRQVHPAASAVLILLVLVGVQWVWWRFLVYRPAGTGPGQMPPPSATRPSDVLIHGRLDVSVYTIAGDPRPGDADGPSHAARFDRPTGIALDAEGNLYIADTGNNKVRMVSPSGDTTTLAGSDAGFADGPVAQARFNAPCGICVGTDKSIYVADTGNRCLRRISAGRVSTLAGAPPSGGATQKALGLVISVAFVPGPKPLLIVAEADSARLRLFTLEGAPAGDRKVPAPPISVFRNMEAVTMPSAGTLMIGPKILRNNIMDGTDEVSATEASRVKVQHPTGMSPFGKRWLVTDSGHRGVLLLKNDKVLVLAGTCSSGTPSGGFRDGDGRTAMFGMLTGIVSDGKRFAYVVDTGNNSIRRLDISEVAAL